ncbi:hypothetical protein PC128_g6553 [Phytophthora cactorum]|nr:hypothetical protein PC128_g6553 [Phytophthora cactorum]
MCKAPRGHKLAGLVPDGDWRLSQRCRTSIEEQKVPKCRSTKQYRSKLGKTNKGTVTVR